jgi:uncharacterized protein
MGHRDTCGRGPLPSAGRMTLMARKFVVRCLLVLVAGFACVFAGAEPVKSLPKPTDYVSDFAHVMSPEVKQRLDLVCGRVDHEARAQIAVVTVHSTDGEPIQQYAVDLYQAWGIGGKKSDRGVLVLFAVNDRRRFISTGYGLESILPDGKVGDIGRQMIPSLRANDFDSAATLAVDQISQVIARDAGITLTPLTRPLRQQPRQIHISLTQIVIFGIFLVLVVIFLARAGGSGLLGFLIGMFLGGGWGGGGGRDGGGDGDGGGSGFGGFGGGSTGGGGAGGDW